MIDERDVREMLRRRADAISSLPTDPPAALRRARRRIVLTLGATLATVAALIVGTVVGVDRLTVAPPPRPATPPGPVPEGWVRFESPFYGYSIAVPDEGPELAHLVTPASTPWAWGEPRRADVIRIDGPTFSFDISIASIAIPDGVTSDEWQRQEELQFRDVKAGTCRQDPTIESIEVDGVPGRILTACDGDVLITLTFQGRGYAIATAGNAVVDHMREFRSTIDTIALHPEQAPPVPQSASEWRGIWPQTSREDAKAAQERADAAGSESVWQVDWNQEGIVAKRFLQEELGWDGSRESGTGYVPGNAEQAWEAEVVEWYLIRCADATNPLYPDHPSMGDCAPTIDRTHFEQVVVRAEQLIRPGRSGIWLITGWEEVEPYAQAVPRTEEEARALMTAFLEARLSGSGAEPLVECCASDKKVELNMYETSGGSPYVRYEFDLMDSLRGQSGSPEWPMGEFLFRVTLFAEDGTTVEEWPYAVGPPSERKVSGCCYFQIRERAP
ncbi:MAG: hypothetical protein HYU54_09575 [Actinobacteria bacterium]|nr:hypothetical protein [Actinomycetota bacterium]